MDSDAAIRATMAPWRQACLDRDWDALLALCTEDAVFAPPGEPQVARPGLKAWLEAFPIMKEFDFSFERVDVSGDLGTAIGNGTWTLEVEGQEVSASFKFADVLRKHPDGSWRYAHVIWNTDSPG